MSGIVNSEGSKSGIIGRSEIDILVGTIASFAMATIPTGFLLCDGTAYNSSTLPQYLPLYNVIANIWGGSDGTNFQVPDLEGAFLRGAGTSTLFTVNSTTTLADTQNDKQQGHYHWTRAKNASWFPYYNDDNITSGTTAGVAYANGTTNAASVIARSYVSSAEGGPNGDVRSGDENRPNNIGVRFYIKF